MSAPDLVAESEKREADADRLHDIEMTLRNPHSLPMAAGPFRLVHADQLPDPYGPDPLVFGPYPKGERC